jgi:hypothetical protein
MSHNRDVRRATERVFAWVFVRQMWNCPAIMAQDVGASLSLRHGSMRVQAGAHLIQVAASRHRGRQGDQLHVAANVAAMVATSTAESLAAITSLVALPVISPFTILFFEKWYSGGIQETRGDVWCAPEVCTGDVHRRWAPEVQ